MKKKTEKEGAMLIPGIASVCKNNKQNNTKGVK